MDRQAIMSAQCKVCALKFVILMKTLAGFIRTKTVFLSRWPSRDREG